FAHDAEEQGELESTTKASLKQVLVSAATQGNEHRAPLEYKGRVQVTGNNSFPFSSHDNRHDICNAGEYFDLVSI
ncbi:TEX36 protein, partial [Spelaeornis formosus]|nr:TEX36 protein [Elachura formosa]